MTTPALGAAANADMAAAGWTAAFIEAGAGAEARKQRRHTVATFISAFTDLPGWAVAPLSARLAAPVDVRAFGAWSALTHQAPVDVTYVAAVNTHWGRHAALVHPVLAATFTATAGRIGFTSKETQRQWAILAELAAISGLRPDQLHRHRFNAARDCRR